LLNLTNDLGSGIQYPYRAFSSRFLQGMYNVRIADAEATSESFETVTGIGAMLRELGAS